MSVLTLSLTRLDALSPKLLWRKARAAVALRRQRAALARLDPDQLDDIGISPEAARIEAARPFWDAPRGWRC